MGHQESFLLAARRTVLHLYRSPSRVATGHTVATFLVEDLVADVTELHPRGAYFEEYDTPDIATVHGVFSRGDGFRPAWIRDSEGNILSLEQLAAPSETSGLRR